MGCGYWVVYSIGGVDRVGFGSFYCLYVKFYEFFLFGDEKFGFIMMDILVKMDGCLLEFLFWFGILLSYNLLKRFCEY